MSNENGSFAAFPLTDGGQMIAAGLTKRELFAAMAMQGLLSGPDDGAIPERIAFWSVIHADALLAELAKDQK